MSAMPRLMQPRPSSDTSGPLRPSLRCFIGCLLARSFGSGRSPGAQPEVLILKSNTSGIGSSECAFHHRRRESGQAPRADHPEVREARPHATIAATGLKRSTAASMLRTCTDAPRPETAHATQSPGGMLMKTTLRLIALCATVAVLAVSLGCSSSGGAKAVGSTLYSQVGGADGCEKLANQF